MPRTLYSTKDSFKKILAWGQNTVDHDILYRVPNSLGLARKAGKGSVQAMEHVVDGVSNDVKVGLGEGEYPRMKHVHGDFGIRADRVILVKRV
jgi:hypothetical protein